MDTTKAGLAGDWSVRLDREQEILRNKSPWTRANLGLVPQFNFMGVGEQAV